MLQRHFTTLVHLPKSVKCSAILLIVIIVLVYVLTNSRPNGTNRVGKSQHYYLEAPTRKRVIHVGIDVCGNRLSEAVTLTKSILLFTQSHIQFHLFLSQDMKKPFTKILTSLPSSARMKFSFVIYDVGFPPGENFELWKSIHKPCASQNLFYTDRLPHVDAIINFDIDIILLRPIDDLWDHFNKFSDMQIFAAAPRIDPDRETLKPFKNEIPRYGQEGLNTGLVLMNLTRMRQFNWTTKALKYFYKYKHLGPKRIIDDQEVTGIIFYFFPDLIYILGCDWNFMLLHCHKRTNGCQEAKVNGISIVHGVGESFHAESYRGQNFPTFVAVFQAFNEHKLGVDSVESLIERLKHKEYLASRQKTKNIHQCQGLYWTFSKVIEKYAKDF